MGSIAAGEPLHVPDAPAYAEESYDTVDLPSSLIGERENMFALRVKGTSMIDALVADGDLVILEPAAMPEMARWSRPGWTKRGDDAQALLHRGRHGASPARKRLHAANHGRAKDVSVRGRVVGVIRSL